MRRRIRPAVIAVLVLVVALPACGGDEPADPSPSASAATGTTGATPDPDVMAIGTQARLAPQPGREDQLGCALAFTNPPKGEVTVALETLGRGVGSEASLRMGEIWDDGEVGPAERPDRIFVFETVEGEPAGNYGCRILGVTDDAGAPVSFQGAVVTLDDAAVAPQDVLAFIADFPRAVREDDRAFLLRTLDPAVLAVYGQDQCAAMLADGFADPSFAMSLLKVRDPRDYPYVADGIETTVPATWELYVEAHSDAGSGEAWVHYAQTDDGLTWFTDCGTPIAGA